MLGFKQTSLTVTTTKSFTTQLLLYVVKSELE